MSDGRDRDRETDWRRRAGSSRASSPVGGRFRNGEPRHPDLSARAIGLPELMDDPRCDPRTLDRTFRRFAVINPLVGGWRRVWRNGIRPVLGSDGSARILDLGCGGGDLARSMARWARADGLDVEVVGVDPDERAIRAARRADTRGVDFRTTSSGDLVDAGERFDVVVSNHVLHHLGDDERDGFLEDSAALASHRVVHSDIRRSRAAYRSYALGAPFVAAGTFVLVDGLRSIRRSYTVPELEAVVPAGWRVRASSPHRILAIRDPD
ncbi:methyltransferase domain-containing protein [Curtobacterium sp. Leaf261]|uniref:methyltransferase domain-containing protein n=1 Tax=Curtobacterium sp. Leaf261 TaxID=1736311 RepID=UPI000AA47F30|nr:methyltransferase domain-containing protein [Curtobacterium sp. Leaf261]